MQKKLPCLFVLMFSSFVVRYVDANSQLDHLGSDQKPARRVKRSSLSEAEKLEVTGIHNHVRSLEGASDMQTMRYNYELAELAQAWADRCQWYHGQVKNVSADIGYQYVGQNLYAISGAPSINLTNVTLSWYNEKPYYNYTTNECPSDVLCGHYTQGTITLMNRPRDANNSVIVYGLQFQVTYNYNNYRNQVRPFTKVVWADSYDIGCGQATCPHLKLLNQSSISGEVKILVCNYGPSGNIKEKRPFQIGEPCSNCSNGKFWCTQKMCNRSCSSNSEPECDCAANCQNGGTVDDSTCTCKCPKGWGDFDCSKKCKNYDGRCDPPSGQDGWPPSWCNHFEYGETIRRYCLLMCKQCEKCSGSVKGYQISPALISTSWIISLLLSVSNLRK